MPRAEGADLEEAKRKFEEAVNAFHEATRWNDDGFLVGWVLVSAQSVVDADGGTSTIHGFRTKSSQPDYHSLGLLSWAQTLVKTEMHRER